MLLPSSSSSHGMREEFVAWELLLGFKILNESQITLRIRIALLGQAWLGCPRGASRVYGYPLTKQTGKLNYWTNEICKTTREERAKQAEKQVSNE